MGGKRAISLDTGEDWYTKRLASVVKKGTSPDRDVLDSIPTCTDPHAVLVSICVATRTLTILNDRRVSGLALYNKIMDCWTSDTALVAASIPPFTAISRNLFELEGGWDITNPNMVDCTVPEPEYGVRPRGD